MGGRHASKEERRKRSAFLTSSHSGVQGAEQSERYIKCMSDWRFAELGGRTTMGRATLIASGERRGTMYEGG